MLEIYYSTFTTHLNCENTPVRSFYRDQRQLIFSCELWLLKKKENLAATQKDI